MWATANEVTIVTECVGVNVPTQCSLSQPLQVIMLNENAKKE